MNRGDKGLFYHSNTDPPAIVGIVEIIKAAYPDHYAFEKKSRYFDPKSHPTSPHLVYGGRSIYSKVSETIDIGCPERNTGA